MPRWWDRTIDFHNVKAGYSKENLVQLIRSFRNQQQESSSTPTRERSPNTSPARLPMISTPINECVSSPILPPPPELTESSPQPEWVVTESDDLVVQEIELYTDDHPLNQTDSMETSQQELELFFSKKKE